MAITWSWAWGPETTTELESMGWDWQNTANGAPSQLFTYSYIGSPARWSMSQDDAIFADRFTLPTEIWKPEGWLCTAFYGDTSYQTNRLIEVVGGVRNTSIYVQMTNAVTDTFSLYVDNIFKQSFNLPVSNWYFIGLKYSMLGATWSGQVYVDGAAVTSNFTDAAAAEVNGAYRFGGISSGVKATYYAGMIVYDSLADAGEVSRFVTRVEPTADTATVGTWTPSVGALNWQVLDSPWNITTYTQNITSLSADNVRVQAVDIPGQLGVTPTAIDNITLHTWASGSGQNGFCALSDNDSTYVAGSVITPNLADPTYAYASSDTQPSGGPWTGASLLYFKYEVS